MKGKKIIIIAVALVIIGTVGIYPMIKKSNGHLKSSNTLKIYAMGQNGHISNQLQNAMDEFGSKYPSIKIEKVMFDNSTEEGVKKYDKTLLSDTLAGNGPDILYLDINDARTLQKSGMLEDLEPLIKKDKTFNKEDYNMKVIDAGLYKGKLTLMPLDYRVNQYTTTMELLKNNNIQLDGKTSENNFMKAIDGYISSINRDRSKTLFASPMSITDFLASSGEEFIDYDHKKVHFDKPEFKELIDDYKKIYNASPKAADLQSFSGTEGFQALKNGTTLFSNDPMFSLKDFLASESLIKGVTKETPLINNIPNYIGESKEVGIVNCSMAINKSTGNKNSAYDFIKIALSENVQSESSKQTANIPVNLKSIKDLENEYTSGIGKEYKYDKSTIVIQHPLSEDFQNYFNKITTGANKAVITDQSIDNLMMECLTPYFQDKTSYEGALKTLENKITIYINE